MDLEELKQRKVELEAGIVNTTNSIWVLRGHLQEVEYQLKLILDEQEARAKAEAEAALAKKADLPVE